MLSPLSIRFNVAVLHIAGKLWPKGFDVSANAPDTFEGMLSQFERNRRHVVWNGASDRTIFGNPEVNYAFRAWHDWHHITSLHPFTDDGENAVYLGQLGDIRALYGTGKEAAEMALYLRAEILGQLAEILGQLAYKNIHGDFPVDQRAFVQAYLNHGEFLACSQEF